MDSTTYSGQAGGLFREMKIAACVVLAVTLAGTLAACSGLTARVRRHTYPPSFNYITQEQLHSTMWQLAQAVNNLDHIIHEPGVMDQERRVEVARLLVLMERATGELGGHGWPSNHPLIDANLSAFRADIVNARRAVEGNPPSYVLAGSVSGACMYCHGER
jgi:hypothetical protein